MKLLSLVLVIIALLGLLAFTNPSMDDYSNFIRQSVMQEAQKGKKDPLGQLFSPFLGGIAGTIIASQTVHNDYIFFSTFDAQFGEQRIKAIGILKRFVLLEPAKLGK